MPDSAPSPMRGRDRRPQRLLLVLGLVMLTVYSLALIDRGVFSRLGLWAFAAARETDQIATTDASSPVDGVRFSLWSAKRIQAYKASLLTKLERPVAVLNIPRLLLTVPIFEGTDDLTLNRGLGRINGTGQLGGDGNAGIAGHRDGFFRGLKDIVQGDTVEITTTEGRDLYVVDEIDIVDPANVNVLQSREYAGITLITCYPFYYVGDAPRRYVVHASLKQRRLQLRSSARSPSHPDTQKEKSK
jgi:sortase A